MMDHVSSVHMKEKLFKCQPFEKYFSRRSGLKAHMAYIHENKPKPKFVQRVQWKKSTWQNTFYEK